MKITVAVDEITQVETPALVVNLFKGVTEPGGATGAVDKALDGAISGLIQDGEIKGSQGAIGMLHTMGKIAPQRVVVVGLGPRTSSTPRWSARCRAAWPAISGSGALPAPLP